MPGRSETHSANRKLTRDAAEQWTHYAKRKSSRDAAEDTLPTGNRPGNWRNTFCRPKIDPGHGGTYSADWKSPQDVVVMMYEYRRTGRAKRGSRESGNNLFFPLDIFLILARPYLKVYLSNWLNGRTELFWLSVNELFCIAVVVRAVLRRWDIKTGN